MKTLEETAGPEGSGALTRRQLLKGALSTAIVGGLVAAGGASPSAAQSSKTATTSGTLKPKPGGDFRLGVTGGAPSDMIDGQNFLDTPDQARLVSQFETLLVFDDDYKVTNDGLAAEVTQDSATQWTIRLRKGIEFSNGKTLQAEDVIYSLQRILDKKNGLPGYSQLASIDAKAIRALDNYTVRLHLRSANSVLDEGLAQFNNGIVPVGYAKWPAPQIGTGAYVLKSFTPGQQSVSTRNKNYWRSGEPYLDTVTITDYAEPTAQVNALLSNEIDAMTALPAAQVPVIKGHGGLSVLVSDTAEWVPICMAIDMPPFDNNDVRQAMRYIVNRPQTVEQVISGYGRVANDLFSPFDPDFDSALPQRHQDIDKAKFLLNKAGLSKLTIDLNTTNGAAGMVELASVFATQAAAAGVTVNVLNDPNFYGNSYLKLAFSVDYWGTRNYLAQVSQSMLSTSPFNETHWPAQSGVGTNYAKLYSQALATLNPSVRKEIIHEMQTIEYNDGGYIIPFFLDLMDAYSSRVAGLNPNKGTLPLDYFGHGFRNIWFT